MEYWKKERVQLLKKGECGKRRNVGAFLNGKRKPTCQSGPQRFLGPKLAKQRCLLKTNSKLSNFKISGF